ncbi:MAG: DJ-1 family glyoxalase III [Candidatus Kapaibacterium sp.]|jgi:4-methyl-5(b-hydroxyethyl)-thiazole monophosphate biosynthesis
MKNYTKKILLPIANGTEEGEAVVLIDLLRRAGAEVLVCGLTSPVLTSHNLQIIPDKLIDDVDVNTTFDAIVLPGGMQGVESFRQNSHLTSIIKNNYSKQSIIAAICAAPLVLKDLNILTAEDKFTCHHSIIEKMYPDNYSNDKVVCMRDIVITSRGLGTAFELGLFLIEKIYNTNKKEEIAKSIIFS